MSPGGLPLLTDGTAWLPAASSGDLVVLELTGCNPVWVAPAEAVSTLGLSHCDQGTDRVAQAIPVRMDRQWAEDKSICLAQVALAFFEAFSGASVRQVPRCLHGIPPKARLPSYLLWYP